MITENRLINLNSADATLNNGDYKSNVYFNFTGLLIDKPELESVELSLLYAQIPVSFYTINVYNNTLRVSINGNTPVIINITRGNYNSTQLIAELTNQFVNIGASDVTITIDTVTGKLKFTKATGTIELKYQFSTCFKVLGFDPSTNYSGSTITAPYPLNLLGTLRLRILSSDLYISSIDSTANGSFGTLASIPVNAPSLGLIEYNNINNTKMTLNLRELNGFDEKIIDDDDNLINFNNIDWTLTLNLTINKSDVPKLTLKNVVNDRYSNITGRDTTTLRKY